MPEDHSRGILPFHSCCDHHSPTARPCRVGWLPLTPLGHLVMSLTMQACDTGAGGSFTLPAFSSKSMTTLGSASIQQDVLLGKNVLVLTEATSSQSGAACVKGAIDLQTNAEFSASFEFRFSGAGGMSDSEGEGADGMVWFMPTADNFVGGTGGGMGYSGVKNSVAVEFDTWDNGEDACDTNGNHIGINVDGDTCSIASAPVPGRLNDGSSFYVFVEYKASTLSIFLSSSPAHPPSPVLSQPAMDLATSFGTKSGKTQAHMCFGAATGGAWGRHAVEAVAFSAASTPFVCAPGFYALGAVAEGALCLRWSECSPVAVFAVLGRCARAAAGTRPPALAPTWRAHPLTFRTPTANLVHTTPTRPAAACGDGELQLGEEECDWKLDDTYCARDCTVIGLCEEASQSLYPFILYTTRQIEGFPPPDATHYVNGFTDLSQPKGYCTFSPPEFNKVANSASAPYGCGGGISSGIAYNFTVTFVEPAAQGGTWQFEFGGDFGGGGVFLLDEG
eukprot:gene1026-2621_t